MSFISQYDTCAINLLLYNLFNDKILFTELVFYGILIDFMSENEHDVIHNLH